MNTTRSLLAAGLLAGLAVGCAQPDPAHDEASGVMPEKRFTIRAGKPVPGIPGEVRLRNVRMLTFGGENAEAYWSNDGTKLVLQAKRGDMRCDQIFTLDLTTGEERMVSTGDGATTCSYWLQGDQRIVYSSTHLADKNCPPPVMRVGGKYVWGIHKGYDLFTVNPDGSDLRRLTDSPGYDAEPTVCPVTGTIVFTSVRDGDLELYTIEPDGSNLTRITNRVGYDGGAFFSHDGSKLLFRSGFPADQAAVDEYQSFLARGLVVPSHMEITVCDRDGSNFRQVTNNGKANFAPYWHPDDRRILFCSNLGDPRGRDFDLYLIDESGENQERVTFNETFDGFPMFSPDGRYLAFASNRFNETQGNTNIFVAEWVENPRDGN